MPIKPLDLQVMFARLNQVGKEQSAQKDALLHQQSLQASSLVKEADQHTHAVNQSQDLGDGVEKSGEQESRKREKQDSKDSEKKKTSGKKNRQEVIKDPDLGTHIDLSG